jgi:hypothetical protein
MVARRAFKIKVLFMDGTSLGGGVCRLSLYNRSIGQISIRHLKTYIIIAEHIGT